jgi:hypothetical protein
MAGAILREGLELHQGKGVLGKGKVACRTGLLAGMKEWLGSNFAFPLSSHLSLARMKEPHIPAPN